MLEAQKYYTSLGFTRTVRTGGTQRRKLGKRRGPREPAVWTCMVADAYPGNALKEKVEKPIFDASEAPLNMMKGPCLQM